MRSASSNASYGAPDWRSVQQRAVPVLFGWRHVLFDTPQVVGYLSGLRVYPSSLHCTVTTVLRPDAGPAAQAAFSGGRPTGAHDLVTAEEILRGPLLGIRYEDGRGAALDLHGRYQSGFLADGELPVFELGASSRDADHAEADVNLYGLPEQGSISLYARWLDFDVPESSIELDGDALRQAAARSLVLWEAPPVSSPESSSP